MVVESNLRLTQDQIHDLATSDVWRFVSAVAQNVGVVAARFFQGVGKDGEPVERSVVVDGLGDVRYVGGLRSTDREPKNE